MSFNRKIKLNTEIPTASMPDIIFMLLILRILFEPTKVDFTSFTQLNSFYLMLLK